MEKRGAQVLVVGLGAMGSASLYQLAQRGVSVIGIDRFCPPHTHGSSHGETRITRQAIGEGAAYTPLVLRSHQIWRELEAALGETLLEECGGLILAHAQGKGQHHGKEKFLQETIAVARHYDIEHEVLSAADITQRFPQFHLTGNESGYYEPGAGFVYPERCIAAQLQAAQQNGAQICTDETVTKITAGEKGVRVETSDTIYEADQAIITAGSWLPRLMGEPLSALLKVYRQVLYWFEPQEPQMFSPQRFPIFIWMHGESQHEYFYGFPTPHGSPGVKVATEQFATTTTPDAVNREVAQSEINDMYSDHIAGRFNGMSARCLKTSTCLYTATPDSGFIIDRHPENGRVIFASACSGHGFKHSAAIGEALAELATDGQSRFDLTSFSLQRFL